MDLLTEKLGVTTEQTDTIVVLDADMVGKFVPVVLDYANTKGGEGVMNLLKGALPLP